METQELDLEISKNQIAIDFDALENTELIEESAIEESSILPKQLVSAGSTEWIGEEVLFVVVKADNKNFAFDSANIDLCGKKMLDWVLIAGSGCESLVLANEGEDLLKTLKSIKTDKKFIALFYSDTPLLDRGNFHAVMDFFTKSGMNVIALPRGYVFRRDFLGLLENINIPCVHEFDKLAFTVVDNTKKLSYASKILYDKIKNYHLKNGITMFGENTIFIDGDVEIESGTIIYPNNILKGQTYIGKNVVLESGNIIEDSIISDDCILQASYIEKSKISKNTAIGPFERVINEDIE